MTQTDNLHLNIWSPQDAVDVEQINSNFQALDAAHAALQQEQGSVESRFPKTLLDVTTQSQVRQVDLDLNTISLADYDWVDLYLDIQPVEGTGIFEICMRVNNNATYSYAVEDQAGLGMSFDLFSALNQDETNMQKIRIFGGAAPVFTGHVTCIVGRGSSTSATRKSIAIGTPVSEVTSLNFFGVDENSYVTKGSRFRMVGVKL